MTEFRSDRLNIDAFIIPHVAMHFERGAHIF